MKLFQLGVATVMTTVCTAACQGEVGTTDDEAAEPTPSGLVADEIQGGSTAKFDEFPFIVALVRKSTKPDNFRDQFCGGSLVEDRFVITAAHCIDGVRAAEIEVLAGTDKLDRGGRRYAVEAIHTKNYDPNSFDNDVAILKLKEKVKDAKGVAIGSAGATGSAMTVVGWGARSTTGNRPAQLQRVTIQSVPVADCKEAYKGTKVDIDGEIICAGVPKNDKGQLMSACRGDSGGPLLRKVGGQWYLAGIVSNSYKSNQGDMCTKGAKPSVYRRANKYEEFLKRVVK